MKILFVFHEANLTGASLNLFRMICWFKKNTDFEMSFLFKEGGPLKKIILDFGDVIEFDVVASKKTGNINRLWNKIGSSNKRESENFKKIREKKFDIIYFNTILSSEFIISLSSIKAIKVWHIHELGLATSLIGPKRFQIKDKIDFIIANSKATHDYLVENGFSIKSIKVLHPVILTEEILKKSSEDLGAEYELFLKDSFTIGSAGTVMERKGVQSFILLIKIIDSLYPANNFKYVWVGSVSLKDRLLIEHDIHHGELRNKLIFVDERSNPFPFYKRFDVFVSTSKEESFGLCAVECACFKKPLVCFDKTGGLQELVLKAENIIVPYLDLMTMANKLIELSENRNTLTKLGESSKKISKEFDENIVMPMFSKYLKELISKE